MVDFLYNKNQHKTRIEIWNLCYFNCLTIRNLNLYYLISFLQTVSVIIATQLRIANLADPADCPSSIRNEGVPSLDTRLEIFSIDICVGLCAIKPNQRYK